MSLHFINILSPPISNSTHFKINVFVTLDNATVFRVT